MSAKRERGLLPLLADRVNSQLSPYTATGKIPHIFKVGLREM